MVALEVRSARRFTSTLAASLLAATAIGLSCPAAADTHVVAPGESIQAVIDDPATIDGDVVVVLPGVYAELLDFRGKAITLQSEDPLNWDTVAATVLDGQSTGSVITCASGEGPDSVLEGFTITGGSNTGGGGVSCVASSPTVRNCIFLDNEAMFEGGAMKFDFMCSPMILNCQFLSNEAIFGGAISSISSTPTFSNCTFAGNTSLFSGTGGAIDNLAMSDALINNCTFYGNTAGSGGAVANTSSTPVLSNCIMWNDAATSAGNEIANFGASPLIAYSNVAGSGGSAAWDAALGTDGGGNIDADPMFADPLGADGTSGTADDDLMLASGSPSVDSGNSGFVPLDSTDLDGDGNVSELLPLDLAGAERFVDATNTGAASVDMGAYERAAEPQLDLELVMDIDPLSCRNRVNRASRGVVAVGVLGSPDVDVTMIDVDSLGLMRADGVGGEVQPWNGRWFCRGPWFFDFASLPSESNQCRWWPRRDGMTDMLLKFRIPHMVEYLELNDVPLGNSIDLILTGRMLDGTPFTAQDHIRVVAPRYRRHYTHRRSRRW